MTVLLPDGENRGKPQLIMTLCSKINYLYASGRKMWKECSHAAVQTKGTCGSCRVCVCVCVCVCLHVWGSPVTKMLVGRMEGGFYGPSGTHVSIPAHFKPLCLLPAVSLM